MHDLSILFHDNDSDPSTPCDDLMCIAGHYSAAGSSSCDACVPGLADLDGDPSTPCVPCLAGTASVSGSTSCTECAAGTADDDSDPGTPCVSCVAGEVSAIASTVCIACVSGRADHDSDPSTACESCAASQYCLQTPRHAATVVLDLQTLIVTLRLCAVCALLGHMLRCRDQAAMFAHLVRLIWT